MGAIGLVAASGALAAPAFDALTLVESTRIPAGPLAGGYLVAPNGELNWYFANLGLIPFVARIPGQVQRYLTLYLARLKTDSTIDDVTFAADGSPTYVPPDSDDSYAATLLSLAVAYRRVPGGSVWFARHLTILKRIADRNLVQSQKPDGLIRAFQSGSNVFSYAEDDSEDYRGLMDFAGALPLGDPAAQTYSKVAARLAHGMQTELYDPAGLAFLWVDGETTLGTKFYPDAVTQVFPQMDGVPLPATEENAAWRYLIKIAPHWSTRRYQTPFPWMLLGYAAALRGDAIDARRQMALLRRLAEDPSTRAAATIEELGYYQRIADLLAGPRR